MSKKMRLVAASFGAVAFSVFFMGGTLAAPPDTHFSVTKEADPATLPSGGGEVTYTITVENTGDKDFHGLALSDDQCTLDNDGSDITAQDKFESGDTYTATCTVDLTKTTTNTVTVQGCTDGSVDQCNQEDHFFEADASATVTVGTATFTVDDVAKNAGPLMLAFILLAIGGLGFLGSTNRLPKLPKIS
jgi:hypothetical protein